MKFGNMITYTGKRVDLLNMRPADVCLEDITRGLARIARYNGHTHDAHAYTVGQHTVLGAHRFPVGSMGRLYFLLHDAHEVYIGDISRPLKEVLRGMESPSNAGFHRSNFDVVERKAKEVVHHRFGIAPYDMLIEQQVKFVDQLMIASELFHLMVHQGNEWCLDGLPEPLTLKDLGFDTYWNVWDAAETEYHFTTLFMDTIRRLGMDEASLTS